MKPEILSKKTLLEGKVFEVVSADIRENGKEYKREIVTHKGSAVIVPVFEDMRVALVKQYRFAADKFILELPAGGVEKGESFEEAALREVEEEIGYRATEIEQLTEFFVSPGFLSEKMHVFLATKLTKTRQNLDDDEMLSVMNLTFDEAFEKIKNGAIEDAKTMVGLMLAGKRFGFDF